MPTEELNATEAALAELASLRDLHGPLMLFQSGGCCDGSSPLCLHEGELLLGPNDLLLGEIGGTPFYIDAEQYERWNRPVFLIDVSPGASDTLSLEGPDDVHFITRTTTCAARSKVQSANSRGCPVRIAPNLQSGNAPMPTPAYAASLDL
jgi:uncharacterized protein